MTRAVVSSHCCPQSLQSVSGAQPNPSACAKVVSSHMPSLANTHELSALRLVAAWDRPRTASRTSAGVGLAWVVGRFAPSRGCKRGRKAGAGRGEGAERRLGRLAERFGVADGRRSGRGGAGRRSTAAAAVFVLAARGGAARGWRGCEGVSKQVCPLPPPSIAPTLRAACGGVRGVGLGRLWVLRR